MSSDSVDFDQNLYQTLRTFALEYELLEKAMSSKLPRRTFIKTAGASIALALSYRQSAFADVTSSLPKPKPREHAHYPIPGKLPLILASQDRVIKETVGLRPFRDIGPNLEVITIGQKTVVNNYGHGGSGWSLSWGSSKEATDKALATRADSYAVIGCGALGLTSAILLQRAGKKVSIYAKERHPNITSSVATGVWSPDSRICLEEFGTPEFIRWWTQTCRTSFAMYQHYLGLAGNPIEWVDTYATSEKPWDEIQKENEAKPGPKFAHLREYVRNLAPGSVDIPNAQNPFSEPFAKKGSRMIFNISTYHQTLLNEFTSLGGKLEVKEFFTTDDFASLPQNTLVNATGLGAKKLMNDKHMHPVRGQLSFLMPQPEIRYSFSNNHAYVIPRRDGLVVGSMENGRYDSNDLSVDPKQTYDAINAIKKSMQAIA